MFLGKLVKRFKTIKLSIKSKLILSLLSIAAILLVSSTISVLEYRSMSNYVSELIADDISSINVANRLSDMTNLYNLQILEAIGEEGADKLPDFDEDYFTSHCDSLRMSSSTNKIYPMADSVMYSYAAFMLTSRELEHVEAFSFLDTRDWYFNRLQPRFNRLTSDIDKLTDGIYKDLEKNSATFERGFYRSIIPGAVAVAVGLLLVLLLMFFLMAYYVNPIYKMLSGLKNYRSFGSKYSYTFEGDDQLSELNDGVTEVVGENIQLRKRIKMMRDTLEKHEHGQEAEK